MDPDDTLQNAVYIISPYGTGYCIDSDKGKLLWSHHDKYPYRFSNYRDINEIGMYIDVRVSEGKQYLKRFDSSGNETAMLPLLPSTSVLDFVQNPETHVIVTPESDLVRMASREAPFKVHFQKYKLLNPFWSLEFSVFDKILISNTSHKEKSNGRQKKHKKKELGSIKDAYYCRTDEAFKFKLSELGLWDDEIISFDLWLQNAIGAEIKHSAIEDYTMVEGSCQGRKVHVTAYPRSAMFSSSFRNLFDTCNLANVVVCRGVEKSANQVLLAYDPYTRTLHDEVTCTERLFLSGSSLSEETEFVSMLRNIIKSVNSLQAYDIFHTDLSPWNVYLSDEDIPKLGDFEFSSDRSKKDLVTRRVGMLTYFCFSKQPYMTTEEFERHMEFTEADLGNMFDWAVEAKDLVRVLTSDPKNVNLVDILHHPSLWDPMLRCALFQDGHQFGGYHKEKLEKAMMSKKAAYFKGNSWKDTMPEFVIDCMTRPDKKGNIASYDYSSPFDLVRFIRNGLVHHQEIINEVKTWNKPNAGYFFGNSPTIAENSFRELFPSTLFEFYKEIRNIKEEDRTSMQRFYR